MMSFRSLHEGLMLALLVTTAWLWLGTSGVGLLALWLRVRPGLAGKSPPASRDWRRMIGSKSLRFARLDAHRILLLAEDGERLDAYRDELAPAELAALRRELKSRADDRL